MQRRARLIYILCVYLCTQQPLLRVLQSVRLDHLNPPPPLLSHSLFRPPCSARHSEGVLPHIAATAIVAARLWTLRVQTACVATAAFVAATTQKTLATVVTAATVLLFVAARALAPAVWLHPANGCACMSQNVCVRVCV